MNDDIESLYAYNRWADQRVLDACRKLTAEQYASEPVPGWSSVRASIVHIAVVTEAWLRGVAGENVTTVPTEDELATVDDAEHVLDRAYRLFEELLPTFTPELLATPRTFSGGGRTVVLPPWGVLRARRQPLDVSPRPGRGQAQAARHRPARHSSMIFWIMRTLDSRTRHDLSGSHRDRYSTSTAPRGWTRPVTR